MHETGPMGVPQPQRTAATLAEVPARRAAGDAPRVFVAHARAVDGNVLSAGDLERPVVAGEIDAVSARAGRLAADRAIAAHVRIRVRRLQAELDGAAVAGAFEFH